MATLQRPDPAALGAGTLYTLLAARDAHGEVGEGGAVAT